MPVVFPCEEDLSVFDSMNQDESNKYLYSRLNLSDYEIMQIKDMISTLRGS